MKKVIYLLIITVFASSSVFAQKVKTPKIEKAKIHLDKGEVVEAKSIIDAGITHEKTKDKSKTWYYRGLIYEAIYLSEDESVSSLSDESFEVAVASFKKVKEIENESGSYFLFSDQKLNNLYANIFNKAATNYQEEEYEEAIVNFNRVKLINPNDTMAYMYAGYAAQQSEDIDLALENFGTLVERNMADVQVFRNMIYIYRSVKKDTAAAIDIVAKGMEAHPEDHDLKQDQITMLIMSNRVDEAKESLLKAIEADPDNYILYYEMGYIYDVEKDYEGSVEWYEKSIERNPDYYESNYNLGVNHFNKGVEVRKEAQNMGVEEYQERGKEVEAQAKVYFEKSLPYFETAIKEQPDDIGTLQTAQTVYNLLGEKDKEAEIKAKLKALGVDE